MIHNIDVSAIHCSHSEAGLSRSNSDAAYKSRRRVRFPEDDKLISDYLEPFRLVPDNCSSEELQAAYLSSCFEHRITPINFLLEQIKGIDLSICNERYSRLSLRGIRLNRFHIETMEAIFQRAHFREIDFENTFLDEQSASALFDMLLHYESCTDLSISLNLNKTLPSQAWSRCVNFMRKSSALRRFTLSHTPLRLENFHGLSFYGLCLERLHFVDCNLTGQALYGLIQWLYVLLSSTSLYPPTRDRSGSLSGCGGPRFRGWRHRRQSGSSGLNSSTTNAPTNINTIASNFSNAKPSIWELKLGLMNNRLISPDVEAILPLIRHQLMIPKISKLENVEFEDHNNDGNNIDENIMSDKLTNNSYPMKSVLLKKSNSVSSTSCNFLPVGGIGYLSELNLSHNNIGDDGLGILCTGLLQSYRNRLRERFSSLNDGEILELTMSSNDSVPNFDLYCTSQSTPMKILNLQRLYLVDNNLGIEGMQALAVVLMQTPKSLISLVGGLTSLDLSTNPNIGDKGIEILCEGLIRNYSLRELYLRSVNMSFLGIFALSSFLSESKCLKYLDIRSNNLDLASIMALSRTLSINKTLTSLVSDARRWANSQVDLSDKDKDLVESLLECIDSSLKRNRLEDEIAGNNNDNNDTNNASTTHCDTTTPNDADSKENSFDTSNLSNNRQIMYCNDSYPINCNMLNDNEVSLVTTNYTSDDASVLSSRDSDNIINDNTSLKSGNLFSEKTVEQLDDGNEVVENRNCKIISSDRVHEVCTDCVLNNITPNEVDKFINDIDNNNRSEAGIKEKAKEEPTSLPQNPCNSLMFIRNSSSESCSTNLLQDEGISSNNSENNELLNYANKSVTLQSSEVVFDTSNLSNASLNQENNGNHIGNAIHSKNVIKPKSKPKSKRTSHRNKESASKIDANGV
ncbi:hypothetical protein MN116_007184 [Schistosoma mekongi]|uniref:Protein phosphatase 1 regulatory subunit 37 n=1 Tax=Schistosoma mekongi TaxID=38744 RepID=A0AAE1Z981_SCHME|nr:hypothetical protein MN116_007184 [Schistosoma mekongi]